MIHPRSRIICALFVAAIIPLGLLARKHGGQLPGIVSEYAPDALWAAMVYWMIAFAFPRKSIAKIALAAVIFSWCIEASQIYHAPWIDNIRANRLAALVLGYGFLWSDLVCYAVGVAVAVIVDLALQSIIRRPNTR